MNVTFPKPSVRDAISGGLQSRRVHVNAHNRTVRTDQPGDQ